MTKLCQSREQYNEGWEGVPVYDCSGEKAVFIVVCRDGDLLVCQRVDEFRHPRLGIRYSDAGIATRSYVTIITRRLSMRLWSSGRQCMFFGILVTLEVCQ